RDATVTGVQTCALPILAGGGDVHCDLLDELSVKLAFAEVDEERQRMAAPPGDRHHAPNPDLVSVELSPDQPLDVSVGLPPRQRRSEERRVGKACRSGRR